MTAEPTSTPPARRLRSRWNAGDPVFGLWTQLGSSHVAELAVAAGYDYVCVDLQHGLADERAMVEIFRATGTAHAAPLWPGARRQRSCCPPDPSLAVGGSLTISQANRKDTPELLNHGSYRLAWLPDQIGEALVQSANEFA